jgi:hypothetical protein
MKSIETVEQWEILKKTLKEKGYRLWQMQYSYDEPQGFHAWFWKSGRSDVKVVTHNKDIQNDIICYNSSQ